MKKLNLYVLICLVTIMNSCQEANLHEVHVRIFFKNKTDHNIHAMYDNKTISLSDADFNSFKLYCDTSGCADESIAFVLDTTIINRNEAWTTEEFVDFLSKFEVFYIEKEDTFKISKTFYDGETYWKRDFHRGIVGVYFYYLWAEYEISLTDDMFEAD